VYFAKDRSKHKAVTMAAILVSLSVSILIAGCTPVVRVPTAQSAPTDIPTDMSGETPSADEYGAPLANMTYQSEYTHDGTATLVNGVYAEPAAPGSAISTTVTLLPQYTAVGELNGQPAAAVILASDPGGSGTFVDLAVVTDVNGMPTNVATTNLGDRVKVNSVTIADNQIAVDMLKAGPDDPMCCPSQEVVQTYELQGDQLVLIDMQEVATSTTGTSTDDPDPVTADAKTPAVELAAPAADAATGVVLAPAGVNVRTGPGTEYPIVGLAPLGTKGEIVGVSEDGQWWVAAVAAAPNGQGWVAAAYIKATNAEDVPVIPAPPLP
jgi:hypothetical protein